MNAQRSKKLSRHERVHVLPLIRLNLKKHIGKNNAVTNKQMRAGLQENMGIEITAERMRAIIHELGSHDPAWPGYALCASSVGYWLTDSKKESVQYGLSLKGRIDSEKRRLEGHRKAHKLLVKP